MGRDIATINQTNLWGRQSDSGIGFEAQRSDLFYVDFASAQKSVVTVANLQGKYQPLYPQLIRSTTLPEIRTKPETIRRDSVPYNMPSWDDPLDPIKITFLLRTHLQDDTSEVIQFLDTWLAITRAGRGHRTDGYSSATGWLTLNANYSVDFRFNVNLFLLRGATKTTGLVTENEEERFFAFQAQAAIAANNNKVAHGLIQQGRPVYAPLAPLPVYEPNRQGAAVEQNMSLHSVYVMRNAWLGAYKMSDFNYDNSTLTTVETTFYADSVDLDYIDPIFGEPVRLNQQAAPTVPNLNFLNLNQIFGGGTP